MNSNHIDTKIKRAVKVLALAVAALAVTGAGAQNLSGSGYTGGQLRSGGQVFPATAVHVRIIDVDKAATAPSNTVSTGVGALLGGLLANKVGNGNGKLAATVVGTVAGGVAGNAVGSAMSAPTQTKGQEIILKSESGETTIVTQEVDGYPIVEGQKVFLVLQNGVRRVVPAQ